MLHCKLRVKVRAQISNDATKLDDVNVSSNLKRVVVLLKFGEWRAAHTESSLFCRRRVAICARRTNRRLQRWLDALESDRSRHRQVNCCRVACSHCRQDSFVLSRPSFDEFCIVSTQFPICNYNGLFTPPTRTRQSCLVLSVSAV